MDGILKSDIFGVIRSLF